MKTILLLDDESETVRLMLKDTAFDQLEVHDTEARAGCNCDRWGHPCPGCHERTGQPDAGRLVSPESKQTR